MSTKTPQEQYHELAFYTLSLGDREFIHQHIVDAFTAQTATAGTKPIALVFALVGLYLFLEKDFTGREVQRFHMEMAKNKKSLPGIILPEQRGIITVSTVLKTEPGNERNKLIHEWCASVWEAFAVNRDLITKIAGET